MNTYKTFLSVLLVSGFLVIGCGKKQETVTEIKEKPLPMVKVTKLTTSPFTEDFRVSGVVKPFATAKLSSEEGGLLQSINKDKGSFVRRGEVVARIKKDVDIASYEQLEAQYELAKMNYEKQEELWKQNATTEVQYLTAKWQMESVSRSLNVLRTRLRTQYVRSPISGYVDEKYMNKGEMTAPGTPIVNIVDVSSVKISAGVPEKYVTDIKRGQQVEVTFDVLPGVIMTGKISYISPTLASTSRTFTIEVIIPNKGGILKPEMTANVQIAKTSYNNAIVIEQDYIIDNGDEKYVFVLEGDSAKKRKIETGSRNESRILVISGLNEGDFLLTEGYQMIGDGDKVKVIN